MTIDLNQLVSETYTQYQREEADAKAEAERQCREAQQAAISAFKQRLVHEIGRDFADALGVTYAVRSDGKGWVASGSWKDQPSETEWAISIDPNVRGETRWHISALEWQWGRNTVFTHSASPGNTRDAILIGLGEVRAKTAAKRTERQADADREAQHQEQRQREYQAAQQELAERQRVHTEILAKIETAKQEAIDSAWKWADGAAIIYYVLSYCAGAIGDGEGGADIDYVKAYTTTDELDARGYITTYSGRYWGGTATNVSAIRLDMNAHKPVWERKTASSVEDLTADLCENIFAYIPGVTRYEGLFQYDDSERAEVVALHDGQPVSWVRQLVDEATE